MDLKGEISMILDHGTTHMGNYILDENYMGFSNLIYHKFMSGNLSSIEKFISEVIGGDNLGEKFRSEMLPKIETEKHLLGDMKKFNVYGRINSRDHVGVEHGGQEIMIDMQLYKKMRKMINDSDLPESEIGVHIYEQSTGYFLLVITHKDDVIFLLGATGQPKQATLFDDE